MTSPKAGASSVGGGDLSGVCFADPLEPPDRLSEGILGLRAVFGLIDNGAVEPVKGMSGSS